MDKIENEALMYKAEAGAQLVLMYELMIWDAAPPVVTFKVQKNLEKKKSTTTITEWTSESKRGATASGKVARLKLVKPCYTDGSTVWVWLLEIKVLSGTGELQVDVEVRTKVKTVLSLPFSLRIDHYDLGTELNTSEPVWLQLRTSNAPRLTVGLNQARVPPPSTREDWPATSDFQNPGMSELSYLLKYIWERLHAKDTLEPAWIATDRRFGLVPLEDLTEADYGNAEEHGQSLEDYKAEERWARRISEMITCIPYGGPDAAHHIKETEWVKKMQEWNDPVYPLSAGCQHLATLLALSRGVTLLQPNGEYSPIESGAATALSIPQIGGTWVPEEEHESLASVFAKYSDFGPGSTFVFYEVSHAFPAHAAAVIRSDRRSKKIQFFDTGAMGPVNTEQNTVEPNANQEYPWYNLDPVILFDKKKGKPVQYRGFGILPKTDLAAAETRLRRARPLGFARLVILKRRDNLNRNNFNDALVYASPLLKMYGPESQNNFSISRLLWSLRECPGCADLEARWLVSVPLESLARMVMGSRSASMNRLADDARQSEAEQARDKAPPELRQRAYDAKMAELARKFPTNVDFVDKYTMPLLDLANRPNGSVLVETSYKQQGGNVFRSYLGVPIDGHVRPAGIVEPRYFIGDWMLP